MEMMLGPRCMTAGIPAVCCTRRHLLQAKQLGHMGECQDKEPDAKRETRETERGREKVWLSVSCHKTWEMLLGLIRVNEATKNERFRSMGKVKVQKFNRRSEGGRVWVEQTGETIPVVFGHNDSNKTFK